MNPYAVYLAGKYLVSLGRPHQWAESSSKAMPFDHEEAARVATLIPRARVILVLDRIAVARVLRDRARGNDVNGWAHA